MNEYDKIWLIESCNQCGIDCDQSMIESFCERVAIKLEQPCYNNDCELARRDAFDEIIDYYLRSIL